MLRSLLQASIRTLLTNTRENSGACAVILPLCPWTLPPGFRPYMGREERRVQGLDYGQFRSDQSNREKWSTSKGDLLFRIFSGCMEPIDSVLDRNLRKFG